MGKTTGTVAWSVSNHEEAGEFAHGWTRRDARRFGSSVMSFVGRHPVASYLVMAFAIFWASWMPVLLFSAPPRPFSAVGAILGLALPAFLVTAATDGRAGSVSCCLARCGGESASVGTCSLCSRFRSGRCSSPLCFSARCRSKDCRRTGLCCSPSSSRSCCWRS
jgi:hypothetical protein